MADPRVGPRPAYEADLHLSVSDARGATTAHLGSDDDGLVLEVEDLAVLLRCLPGRGLVRALPLRLPVEVLEGSRVRLTSGGRNLARATVTPRGGFQVVPTPIGVVVLTRAAGTTVSRTAAARAAVALAAAVALVVWAARRRS